MKKYIVLSVIALSGLFVSCDDYLDKLPDNRMELKTAEEIKSLLVSAYATNHPAYLLEMYSDNTDECINTGWTEADRFQRQAYQWDDVTEIGQDETPQELWNGYYRAIAACNAAIEHIDGLNETEKAGFSAQLGEALVCRAYNMFVLSLVFCNAYDASTAASEPGLPYPTATETVVGQQYERGTLAELYERIEADLQKGLPLITNNYSKPKFHFTNDAANAFAARFYLYYNQNDKAITYASKVLGDNAGAKLRNWDYYNSLEANGQIQPEAFVAADERANLLLQTVYSEWGAVHGPYVYADKYAHNHAIAYEETMRSEGPWGSSADFKYTIWYNNSRSKFIFRKVPYEFEMTDIQAQIGFAHSEFAVFTTDILLLERAEAYALSGNLQAAVKDINTELAAFHTAPKTLTVENITEFYKGMEYYQPQAATPKKHLKPKFTIGAEGSEQESVLQCILQLRRILTLHEGFRMQDIKRYGITIYRRQMNSSYKITNITDTMEPGDKRLAIQLPQDVISAGLPGNERDAIKSVESLAVEMPVTKAQSE